MLFICRFIKFMESLTGKVAQKYSMISIFSQEYEMKITQLKDIKGASKNHKPK